MADKGSWFTTGNPATPTAGVFTVPAGFGVQLCNVGAGTLFGASASGTRGLHIRRDTGSGFALFLQGPNEQQASDDNAPMHIGTPVPILVSEGDVFEVQVYQDRGGALNVLSGNGTYFTIAAAN